MDLSIGELSRASGVPVKTVRYYSDLGLVPEAGRSPGGYRRYDSAGLARLELVRALRELGIDLATVRAIVDSKVRLDDVAAAQADALDLHIRQLTMRRSVLRAVARSGTAPEEVRRMTAFARASAEESRRIMEEFLTDVFAGNPGDPFAERMKAALPELPADPSPAQVDAWVELAALVADRAFRAHVREMVLEGARRRAGGADAGVDAGAQQAAQAVAERAGSALEAGIAPGSVAAAPIVNELAALHATAAGSADGAGYRRELAEQLASFTDTRVERYWQLIGAINGWPPRPSMVAPYQWFIEGLRSAEV